MIVIIGFHNVAAGTVAGIVDYKVVGSDVGIVGSEVAIGPHTAICNA